MNVPKVSAPIWDPKITLGNVLTVAAMLGALVTGYMTLKADVANSAQQIVALQQQSSAIPQLQTDMAVVKRNQDVGKDARLDMQADISAIRNQNVQILQQLAALAARLDEQDRHKP